VKQNFLPFGQVGGVDEAYAVALLAEATRLHQVDAMIAIEVNLYRSTCMWLQSTMTAMHEFEPYCFKQVLIAQQHLQLFRWQIQPNALFAFESVWPFHRSKIEGKS